jgi:hypothetical protein
MIDAYSSAIQNYDWTVNEADNSNPAWTANVSSLVKHVLGSEKVANQIRWRIDGGEQMSLQELYFTTIKHLDDNAQIDTPQLINNASEQEKIVAHRVWTHLKGVLPNYDHTDLKCATLLFGMNKIKSFVQTLATAAPAVAAVQNAPSLQQMEMGLAQMQAFRAQLTDEFIAQNPMLKPQRDLLDTQITQMGINIDHMRNNL